MGAGTWRVTWKGDSTERGKGSALSAITYLPTFAHLSEKIDVRDKLHVLASAAKECFNWQMGTFLQSREE